MKRLFPALLLLPVLAHARYQDLAGDEPGQISEINLAFYIFGGLAAWCWLVADGGLRLLWLPLALGVGCAIALFGWGLDGLGFMAISTPVAMMIAGAFGAFQRKDP